MSDSEFILEKNPESISSVRFRRTKTSRAIMVIKAADVGDRIVVSGRQNYATMRRAIKATGVKCETVLINDSKWTEEDVVVAFYLKEKPRDANAS